MGRKTVHNQKSKLDQFYTASFVARKCFDRVIKLYGDRFDLYLEPSAGTGSFLEELPRGRRFGLDLDPQHPEVVKEDFFKFTGPPGQDVIVIGNPPFGRNSQLAKRFFNHAASFVNVSVVAFIVPKTFRKDSMQNQLSLDFVLKSDMELPSKAFVFNCKEYNVPASFQIWERSNIGRTKVRFSIDTPLFVFVSKKDSNVAIRRVGGRAGKATTILTSLPEQSYYFLKLETNILGLDKFVEIVNGADFSDTVNSTAGVRSLSKPELLTKLRSLSSLRGKI